MQYAAVECQHSLPNYILSHYHEVVNTFARYFQYNSRRIARNAIYDLVNNSYSIKDIKLVYTDYKSFFPKYAFLFFYCTYIYLVLVYILKKMIKFILGYNRI